MICDNRIVNEWDVPTNDDPNVSTSFTLPHSLKRQVDQMAKKHDVSSSDVIRKFLQLGFREGFDPYDD